MLLVVFQLSRDVTTHVICYVIGAFSSIRLLSQLNSR